MKHALIALAVLCLPALSVRAEPVDLILVSGQSNAVGFCANPSEVFLEPNDKNILFWWRCGDPPADAHDSTSGDKWTHLQPQPRGNPLRGNNPPRQYGNFMWPDGGFGPEIGFARTLYAAENKAGQPVKRIAVLKVAFSGTGMRTDWNPADPGEGGACYRALVSEAKAAATAARAQGVTFRVRALVWVQGETDATEADAPNYEKALAAMLAALRKDLNSPRMIALVGINAQFGGGKNAFMPKIIEAQKALGKNDPRCAYVDTAGLGIVDAAHFNTAGTLGMGKRFAETLQKLEGQTAVRK